MFFEKSRNYVMICVDTIGTIRAVSDTPEHLSKLMRANSKRIAIAQLHLEP